MLILKCMYAGDVVGNVISVEVCQVLVVVVWEAQFLNLSCCGGGGFFTVSSLFKSDRLCEDISMHLALQ